MALLEGGGQDLSRDETKRVDPDRARATDVLLRVVNEYRLLRCYAQPRQRGQVRLRLRLR